MLYLQPSRLVGQNHGGDVWAHSLSVLDAGDDKTEVLMKRNIMNGEVFCVK